MIELFDMNVTEDGIEMGLNKKYLKDYENKILHLITPIVEYLKNADDSIIYEIMLLKVINIKLDPMNMESVQNVSNMRMQNVRLTYEGYFDFSKVDDKLHEIYVDFVRNTKGLFIESYVSLLSKNKNIKEIYSMEIDNGFMKMAKEIKKDGN